MVFSCLVFQLGYFHVSDCPPFYPAKYAAMPDEMIIILYLFAPLKENFNVLPLWHDQSLLAEGWWLYSPDHLLKYLRQS